MTTVDIEKRILEIESIMGDYERAHALEDLLYLDFIRYISKSTQADSNLRQKAKSVLQAQDLDFPRYCA